MALHWDSTFFIVGSMDQAWMDLIRQPRGATRTWAVKERHEISY